MKGRSLTILILVLVLLSCKKEPLPNFFELDVENGWFPNTPANISELNTGYDDYNSNLKGDAQRIELYYSNNYDKKGKDFDISGAVFDIYIPEEENGMSFQIANADPDFAYQLLPLVNSEHNEFGPYSFYEDNRNTIKTDWYFLYANDKNGDFDIHFCYTDVSKREKVAHQKKVYGPVEANVLNSNVCDWYPTINKDHSKMYFSSYRTGNYNIYEIDVESNNLRDWLVNGTSKAMLNETLSSSEYDNCPYINGNLMVFASKRDGGFGGYDLYFSTFENGSWTAPINFGPGINTQHDEFRPAVEYFPQSNNDFMIFSSNRPGGNGGFDLYFVGIDKMIK